MFPEKIEGFQGEYRFLSNFWPAEVRFDGVWYPTTEHAYQAAKSLDPEYRKQIEYTDSPGKVKRLSRKISLRPDWDEIKLSVMQDLSWQKYTRHSELRAGLLSTGDAYIEETNSWGDRFWGVSGGTGQNNLGKILMSIRERLRGS
jgi:ribA/ribD-fused uncharacterized protein